MTQLSIQVPFAQTFLDAVYAALIFGSLGMILLIQYLVRHAANEDAAQRLAATLPKFALMLITWSLFAVMSVFFPTATWLRVVDGIVGCAGVVAGIILYRHLKAAAAH